MQAIAEESHSESKWKQLGELAMSSGKLDVAGECLRHAKDLSGLLLLYSAVGDAEGLEKLSVSARENGKNNVAFVSLFLLGKVEECVELLIESNRIPEAAFMARTYLPSQVSRIVALWRNDLKKINQKAAESLADPEEYPNLFPDWDAALAAEVKLREQRTKYLPASKFLSYINGDDEELTEELQELDINGDEPSENGHGLQEVHIPLALVSCLLHSNGAIDTM
jgi:coatomer subunit beta'